MTAKLRTAIVAAALTAAAAGAAYILSSHSRDDANGVDGTQTVTAETGFYGITVELCEGRRSCDSVAMGVMHEGERVVRTVRFVNRTSEPITLLDYRSSCGCTSIDLPRHAIAPEAYADAECTFDSRGEYGAQLNVVEIVTSDTATTAVLMVEAEVE